LGAGVVERGLKFLLGCGVGVRGVVFRLLRRVEGVWGALTRFWV
jgi:hypothetical protein